jgi:Tfp pilus assembly protein FimT
MRADFKTKNNFKWQSENGRSMVEMLAVVAIASILTAVAIPQIISARRLIRSTSLPREVATQLKLARQLAMSQRQAFTFQYDNSTKQITIFDHNNVNPSNPGSSCNMSRTQILSASGFPNTACTTIFTAIPLAGGGGLPTSEVSYGVPTGISNGTLGDNTTVTALSSNKITVTFQPDGSVVDTNDNPINRSLFFYNNTVPTQTASAISVLGAAGRIKVWRYNVSASKYDE